MSFQKIPTAGDLGDRSDQSDRYRRYLFRKTVLLEKGRRATKVKSIIKYEQLSEIYLLVISLADLLPEMMTAGSSRRGC